MGILKKVGLLGLCFTLLSGCYSQGSGNSIDATIPDKLAAYSTHTIEITIKKGPNSSFSKYQLECPANVTVKEGISKDGNFSFEKQVAKYVWVESPKTDEFTVTMILEVGNATGQALFEHRYYYIEGEARKEISDGPMHVEFTPGTPKAVSTPTKSQEVVQTPTTSVPQTTPITKTDEPKKTNITITPSGTTNLSNSNTSTTVTSTTPDKTSSNTTPQNVEVKEYKVQIGSFGAKPSLAKYSDIGKVTVVEENGVWKILAGSFTTKEEAVKKMEELKAKGHQGFVVVYVNGVKAK